MGLALLICGGAVPSPTVGQERFRCSLGINGGDLTAITAAPMNLSLDFIATTRRNGQLVVFVPHPDQIGVIACDQTLEQRSSTIDVGTPQAIASGQIDEDFNSDLAVVGARGAVASLGNGMGDFATPTVSMPPTPMPTPTLEPLNDPRAVVVADFDGDNLGDLAVGTDAGNNVELLYGKGDGTFEPKVSLVPGGIGGPIVQIATKDLYIDGRPDLVALSTSQIFVLIAAPAATPTPGQTRRCSQQDTGCFTRTAFTVPGPLSDFAIEDFDADGSQDVAVVSSSGQLSVLFGVEGAGSYALDDRGGSGLAIGADVTALATGFIDSDRRPDLVVAKVNRDELEALINDGEGGFQRGMTFAVGDGPQEIVLARVDDDDLADIVTRNLATNEGITILLSSPVPSTPLPSATPTPTHTPTPEDTLIPSVTATFTPAPSFTPVPTKTCPPNGICVQGEGCATIAREDGGGIPWPLFGLVPFFLLLRRRWRLQRSG